MLRKSISLCLVAALAVVLVAGCGGEKNVDPYATVTLRQATYGPPVISKGFKYKLVNPEILEATGHLALIREGDITSLLAGRSLADKLENVDKSHVTFNVVKKYSPYVHFKVDEVISGQDTVFISQAGSVLLPEIIPGDQFTSSDYDATDLNRFRWNDSGGLQRMVEKKYAVKGDVVQVEEDGNEVWMLKNDRTAFRITDPTDGMTLILRLMEKNKIPFEGGITYNEVEDWPARRNNHIAGSVSVDWMRFAGKVFKASV